MAIDTVAEEVANNLEEIAAVTRRVNVNSVGFFIGGTAFGFALGFYWGYKFNKEKIKAEAFRQSEEEVDKIRDEYRQRMIVTTEKHSVDDIIKKKGYSDKSEETERPVGPAPGLIPPERPLRPPVVITPPPSPPDIRLHTSKDKNHGWNYARELQERSAMRPYVIHQDEFNRNETGYRQVEYTYFSEDDVLVDESMEPVSNADAIVGEDNLKWGHGSEDSEVVFVRNDKAQLEIEITRSPNSFEEHMLGLENDNAN